MIETVSAPTSDDAAIVSHQLTAGRNEWQEDESPIQRNRSMSVQCQLEEMIYQQFLHYFKHAEARRRWSVENDIPWEKASSDASDLTALLVESFSSVEMFLPDYTSKIMGLIRESRGRAWFQANWGYEEEKHSMALEKWLITSGKRTESEMAELEWSLLGAEWNLPFDTPRQMICYTMVQELATGVNYVGLRKQVEENEKDECLLKVLRWLSADESAHYNFFRRGVKAYLALQPDETVADLKFVFENFAMPAHALIPNWEERGAKIEQSGVYGPRIFLSKIYKPVLEDLGLSRTQLKEAGVPYGEAEVLADQMEDRAERAAHKPWQRVHSLPSFANLAPSTRKTISLS